MDFDDLKRRYGEMIVGDCHEVSNAEGTGFGPLRESVRREAARLKHMGRRYNKRWLAARDDALAHPEPRITREAFDGIAKKHELTDDAVEVWLNLLHDLGRIVYYGDDEGLRDAIVIKPQWLTEAISYVLEDKLTRGLGGFLEHARLPEIWKQYQSEHYPFFLRLMEKFDISYRDSERQASLVGQLRALQAAGTSLGADDPHSKWCSEDIADLRHGRRSARVGRVAHRSQSPLPDGKRHTLAGTAFS